MIHASNLLLNAYTRDEIVLGGDEQRLIGLINRMRFFASPDIVAGAETVLRAIVEISLKPSIELRQLAKDALSKHLDPDPLLAFSSCAGQTWTTCAERQCEASAPGSKPARIQVACVGNSGGESSGNSLSRLVRKDNDKSSSCVTMFSSRRYRSPRLKHQPGGRLAFSCVALLRQRFRSHQPWEVSGMALSR